MGKRHYLAERRHKILAALEEAGELSVAELSARFDVSEVTIRHDLQALSDQGALLRTRGGALSTNTLPELSFDIRQQQRAAEKSRIAQAAASLISNGDTIFIDASTTAQAIIPLVKQLLELTVITNCLKAAMGLLDSPQIHVILPGGNLRRNSISVVGPTCHQLVDDVNIQVGFFGAQGLTLEHGLTDIDLNEVATKRAMVKRCRQVVGLLDSSKWGRVAATTFASAEEVHTIISDAKAPSALVDELRQRQVEVVLV